MALILKYRVEPPAEVNQAVYAALADQVGKVGITITMPLGDDGKTQLSVTGEFVSVEGEHFAPDLDPKPVRSDDRTPEELRSGPSSLEADRVAGEWG